MQFAVILNIVFPERLSVVVIQKIFETACASPCIPLDVITNLTYPFS